MAADTQPLAVEFTSPGLFDGALMLIASTSSEQTRAAFRLRPVEGNHFAVFERAAEVQQEIANALGALP